MSIIDRTGASDLPEHARAAMNEVLKLFPEQDPSELEEIFVDTYFNQRPPAAVRPSMPSISSKERKQ